MSDTWHLRWPGAWVFFSAVIFCAAILAAAYVLVGPVRQTVENCQAIEEHKRFHRQEAAFDLKETREVLRELGIDPDSDAGKRLIERGRRNAEREQARFAPEEC